VVVTLFWLINRDYRVVFLIVFSTIFYGFWSYIHLILLVVSIIINFEFAKKIEYNNSKLLLTFAIIFNISPLFYFKYSLGVEDSNIILPLAISFYTFQQIAFLIDLYQKKIKLDGFREYLFFVLFFPQLVAGPIVHYNQLISQIKNSALSKLNINSLQNGILLFSIGLFKKVALADSFFVISNSAFGAINGLDMVSSWVGLIAYSLGIYFDFSAYSDMAIGLGLMFGIVLPINFNSPYKARNIIDFWRKWHITLSDFLKNYIYIPLGGNRHGKYREVASLILTMSIGGVWHGVGWGFLVWGFAHGVLLVLVHLSRDKFNFKNRYLSIFITFIAVTLLWVLFRASSISEVWQYYGVLFSLNIGSVDIINIIIISLGLIIIWFMPNGMQIISYPKLKELKWYYAIFGGVLMFISLKIMAVVPAHSFVYFNF
jgi:D-alanyl-lipoteichoic acid acyltransferase DltB (MBOAT superfamily)